MPVNRLYIHEKIADAFLPELMKRLAEKERGSPWRRKSDADCR